MGLLVEPDNITEVLFRKSPFENLDEDNEKYGYSNLELFWIKIIY